MVPGQGEFHPWAFHESEGVVFLCLIQHSNSSSSPSPSTLPRSSHEILSYVMKIRHEGKEIDG